MKTSRVVTVALAFSAGLLLFGCQAREATEPTEDEAAPALPARSAHKLRSPPEYAAVSGTEGRLRRATLFSQKVPTLGAAIEVHSLTVLPKQPVLLPADRESLYEVLGGEVESESGGERKLHRAGDLWLVEAGAHVSVRARGELAVLRAIVLSGK
jgi:hypothetical protein